MTEKACKPVAYLDYDERTRSIGISIGCETHESREDAHAFARVSEDADSVEEFLSGGFLAVSLGGFPEDVYRAIETALTDAGYARKRN